MRVANNRPIKDMQCVRFDSVKKHIRNNLPWFSDDPVHLTFLIQIEIPKIKMFITINSVKQICWLCKCSGFIYVNENKCDVSKLKKHTNAF